VVKALLDCGEARFDHRRSGGTPYQDRDEHSALAKAVCTYRMREAVGWARELLGGNGIVLDYNVGRFVADAEAIYSYEGTREMNSLVTGRAITGLSAFV
jgi:glutaryl-CoA dehydrogenase